MLKTTRGLVHENGMYVHVMLCYKVGREREGTPIHEQNRMRNSVHVHKTNDMDMNDICRYTRIRIYEYAAMQQLSVSVMKLRIFEDEKSGVLNTLCVGLHMSTAYSTYPMNKYMYH
jgi:hypothetical protein